MCVWEAGGAHTHAQRLHSAFSSLKVSIHTGLVFISRSKNYKFSVSLSRFLFRSLRKIYLVSINLVRLASDALDGF